MKAKYRKYTNEYCRYLRRLHKTTFLRKNKQYNSYRNLRAVILALSAAIAERPDI